MRPSNQSIPVTRPLSVTGERESCSVLVQGGDASAWPPFCCMIDYKDTEKRTGILKPCGDWSRKDSTQRGRPAVPDHWTGRPGGSGAQPPFHLIYMVKVGHISNHHSRRIVIAKTETDGRLPLYKIVKSSKTFASALKLWLY